MSSQKTLPRYTVEDTPDGRFRVIDWGDRGLQVGPDLNNRDIAAGLAERMERLAGARVVSDEVVESVADVAGVAAELGLQRTDHAVTAVHGQWSARGVLLSATEDAPGWVRATVEARSRDGRRVFVARFDGGAPLDELHSLVAFALAGHERAENAA